MYYLYHIPGKKIGVTRDLNNRVTIVQGYKPTEYEVLFTSDDVNWISEKELELQDYYGYKIDRQKYNDLYKLNKMSINVTEQTTTFPVARQDLADWLINNETLTWTTSHGQFNLDEQSRQWILANSKKSMYNENRTYIYNKAYYEEFINPTDKKVCTKKPLKMFEQIRSWATERGIYENGDVKTQFIKLQEETGELAKALLNKNEKETIDAIGDIVVVLTNLAYLKNLHIETCIDYAYKEIKDRTGNMINGTFVKDED